MRAKRSKQLLPQVANPRARPNRRGAVCVLLCLAFFFGSLQSLRAQQSKLPSAEKIVDGYLKAIGGKKRVAAIRDATYEWQIKLKDLPLGLGRTQTKVPSSVRSELTFGNG